MPFSTKIKNLDRPSITEQRDFTNPHIRFRRIRGRIVPIINNKRIGQDFNKLGDKAMIAGAAVGAAAITKKAVMKTKMAQKAGRGFGLAAGKVKRFSAWVDGPAPTMAKSGLARKIVSALGSGTFKAGSAFVKHPGKIGLALAGFGLAAKMVGTDLEVNSAFGKDFFFTKDEVFK